MNFLDLIRQFHKIYNAVQTYWGESEVIPPNIRSMVRMSVLATSIQHFPGRTVQCNETKGKMNIFYGIKKALFYRQHKCHY